MFLTSNFILVACALLLLGCDGSGSETLKLKKPFGVKQKDANGNSKTTTKSALNPRPQDRQVNTKFVKVHFVGNQGDFTLTSGTEKIAELLLHHQLGIDLIILEPNQCKPSKALTISGTRRLAIEDLAQTTAQITYAYEINQKLVDEFSGDLNQANLELYKTLLALLEPLKICAWHWNYKLNHESQNAIEHNWQVLADTVPRNYPNLELPSHYKLVPIWLPSKKANTPTLYFRDQSLTNFYHYILVVEFFRDFRYSKPSWVTNSKPISALKKISSLVTQKETETFFLIDDENLSLFIGLKIESDPIFLLYNPWDKALGGLNNTIHGWRIVLEEVLAIIEANSASVGL